MSTTINFEDYFPTSDTKYPFIPHAHGYDTVAVKSNVNFTGAIDFQGSTTISGLPITHPFITVGFANADYICTGVNDNLQLQAAVNALPSGGTIYIMAGTYMFTDTVTINTSNIVLQGSGIGITTLQATTPFNAANNALITLNNPLPSVTINLTNITIQDMTINENNVTNVHGIKVRGGAAADNDSTSKITIKRVQGVNLGTVDVGHVTIFTGQTTGSYQGNVSEVLLEDCDFLDTVKYHVYINGCFLSHFKINRCKFRNSQYGCVGFNQVNKNNNANGALRSHQDWEFSHCYLTNNGLSSTPLSGFVAYFPNDSNKTGIRGLNIHDNYFLGQVTTIQQYCISLQSCWDVRIHNNTFWQTRTVFNIGQSNNGPWFQENGCNMASIKNNVFYQCYNICDHDSDFFADWSGNTFVEVGFAGLNAYSRHWPSKYHDNFFYNTPTITGGSASNYAAFAPSGGDGSEIYNNVVVDDRLLANPTTAPVLTTVSGGSQGSRTYYVKYTWLNDTGETLASSESNTTVTANHLLVVTHPYTTTYGPPTGAKFVNIYVGTSSGAETLQVSVPTAWQEQYETTKSNTFGPVTWTEPTTGLVTGAALPVSNTTTAITLYGVYETSGASGPLYPNYYHDNRFFGIATPFFKQSAYKRITRNNFTNATFSSTAEQKVESIPYVQGNITGATTFDVGNGEVIAATFTGNVTSTLASGHYVGQTLERRFTMGGSGSYTYTRAANEKLASSSYTPTTSVGAVDILTEEWDGTNWVETSRALNVG